MTRSPSSSRPSSGPCVRARRWSPVLGPRSRCSRRARIAAGTAATTKTRFSSDKRVAGRRMAIEIERKFLIKPGAWTPRDAGTHIQQGYLSAQNGPTVRVRIECSEAGSSDPACAMATLTVKGPTTGLSRSEFEYPLPLADARHMLDQLCRSSIIDKHRYRERYGRHTWEIDVFHG